MRVKTRIIFEVEYSLDMDFYDKDEDVALEMEKASIEDDPIGLMGALNARGDGIFNIKVEKVG